MEINLRCHFAINLILPRASDVCVRKVKLTAKTCKHFDDNAIRKSEMFSKNVINLECKNRMKIKSYLFRHIIINVYAIYIYDKLINL